MAEETKKTAPAAKPAERPAEDTPEVVSPEVVSADADKSTYKENPDPNPDDVHPAPGPSTIQEPGKP